MSGLSDFSARQHKPLIDKLARAMGHDLEAAALDRLVRYVELVVSWNKKLDLTAAHGVHAQLEVLLADALFMANPLVTPPDTHLVDVGSGAGAPGLPLLLARSDLRATLVEPLHKRVAFLRTVVGTLACVDRTVVLNVKIDPLAPTVTGMPFDVALSRATFAPDVWVPAGLKLAPRTLALLAAQPAPAAPHDAQRSTLDYALPWSGAPRQLAIYTRTAQ
jgi:16S rRNA (guanine527-N7)-methyltransferase